jgi:hypothetical protein
MGFPYIQAYTVHFIQIKLKAANPKKKTNKIR